MSQDRYTHIQHLFNSLYSYFKIPLQLKKGRTLLAETRGIPAGFNFSRQSENSLFSFDIGNMTVTASSAGEIFAELYRDDGNMSIITCVCHLIDIAPLRHNSMNPNQIIPLCTVTEFTAFLTLLYNYFAVTTSDELPTLISANIHLIFNGGDIYLNANKWNSRRQFDELATPYAMIKYDWMKLDLVRSGDIRGLKKFLYDEKNVTLSKYIFYSVSSVQDVIDYTLPLLIQFTAESGGDLQKIWPVYHKYKNHRKSINSISAGVSLYNDMLTEFCNIVHSAMKKRYSPKVNNALEYINSNWKNKISVDDICQKYNVSKAYLMKLFKKETGFTIIDYVTNIRMNYINHMLIYSNEPVAHIAAEAGYSSQSYMTAVYKSKYGITPMEYKKKHFTSTLSEPSDAIRSAKKED